MAVVAVPTSRLPLSPPAASAQGEDPLYQIYSDDVLFDKLSGAARSVLELKYGRKKSEPPSGEGGPETPSLVDLPNVLVNNPGADGTDQDTQSETTIVRGSGSTVVVGFNDSGSYIGGNLQFTGYSRSANAGDSFTDQGTLPLSPGGDAGDPVLARDTASGVIYFSTLEFATFSSIQCFRSTNDGVSFGQPVNATPGVSGFQDKEWITVDNFPGAGRGNVYLAWRRFSASPAGIYFTRSTDGGNTWGPFGGTLIADEGNFNVQGAFVTVGPDHAVYVFWYDQSSDAGGPAFIKMRKSTDQGQTFGPAVTVASLRTTGVNGNLGLGGFRTNAFPQAVVNPVSNNVYVVFADKTTGSDRADTYFTQSVNGGTSWSAPVRVNDDATTRDQWQPALAVTPNGRNLFVGYLDRRLDAANFNINTFGTLGAINGSAVTFGASFRISTASFPPVFGQDPAVNSTYMGDYDQAVADNTFFYYTWGDNRLGNAFHQNQPDVRFTKIRAPRRSIPFDFDGNGTADVSVVRPYENTNYLWYTPTVSDLSWGLLSDVLVPADYDGDGRTDVAVWRSSTGIWYIIPSSTNVAIYPQWGTGGDIPVPGDYDGDGKTDLAVFRPSNGTWYILNSTNGQASYRYWGLNGDRPVPADYDGDGLTDAAVIRPNDNHTWYILNSSTNQASYVQWGLDTDQDVPGDYDGDGKTDQAVRRTSDNIWYIRLSTTGQMSTYNWGLSSDIAVPADYDGDGRTDIAVWRPSNGTWYIVLSSTGQFDFRNFGQNGDVPLPTATPRG